MSGSENIKGFDYQISYSLLKTLELLGSGVSTFEIQFESLEENEEDFNVFGLEVEEYHQLKKRAEGNHWSPGDLKEIFSKFILKDKGSTQFYFVTDGTANPEVKKLKQQLNGKEDLDDKFLIPFLPDGVSIKDLKNVLSRTNIQTRFFASDDDSNPAKNLKTHVSQLLNRPPFELKHSVNDCYSSLWKLIFDYSRNAKPISINQIKSDFESAGVFIIEKPWIEIPKIDDFQGREIELKEILQSFNASHKIIVYGINGIGKTWITTKIIQATAPDVTCWISINRWTSIERVLFLFTSLLYSVGHEYEAKKLQGLDISDRIPAFTSILESIDVTIVFDSINSAGPDLNKFLQDFIEFSLVKQLKGKIIITSTKKIAGYTEIDIENGNISEYYLQGFSIYDTHLILSSLNDKLSEEEIINFHKAVAGHPMAIFFLKKLIGKKSVSTKELLLVGTRSIEAARDWIIEKSIMQLSAKDKEFLLTLSILEGEIEEEEINYLLEEGVKSKYLLHELQVNHLINFQDDKLSIHDAIKEVAKNMLSREYSLKVPKKMADYYFEIMKIQESSGEGILYEAIMKWGYHVEQLENSDEIDEKYSMILRLSNEEINALWAIRRFGYPFDFETEDLSSSDIIVKALVSKQLIEENDNPEIAYFNYPLKYVLKNIDRWQECFISYLCLARELSNHMGYIPIFKPNHAWDLQHASCWWEHCIEYMPLPPITKSDRIEHLKFIKEQFEKGAYEDKTPEEKASLQSMLDEGVPADSPEERDLEMENKRCPIWGHCCPDGKEQALECTQYLEEAEDEK